VTFRLGLTGSIGMGKSATAAIFARRGIPVWDADRAVRRLYAKGGAATGAMAALAPDVVLDGAVSKDRLVAAIARDAGLLDRVEAIVHPLVRDDRERFAVETAADIAVFDIPLLYETGAEAEFDAVAVVSAPPDVQRARVLARPGMDTTRFEAILARQLPDADKCARADFVIPTTTPDAASRAVDEILRQIEKRLAHA